jgi:hypothetical protein
MDNAFNYIIANHGVSAESQYPYRAQQGSCKFPPAVTTIKSFKDISKTDILAQLQAGHVLSW